MYSDLQCCKVLHSLLYSTYRYMVEKIVSVLSEVFSVFTFVTLKGEVPCIKGNVSIYSQSAYMHIIRVVWACKVQPLYKPLFATKLLHFTRVLLRISSAIPLWIRSALEVLHRCHLGCFPGFKSKYTYPRFQWLHCCPPSCSLRTFTLCSMALG